MKDEEFETKLEFILKTLYDIDREVKKYLDEKKPTMRDRYYKIKAIEVNDSILDDRYKT
jgi:hypothetical protein